MSAVAKPAVSSLTAEAQRPSDRTGLIPFLRMLFSKPQAQIGGVIILILVGAAIFAPWIAPYDPLEIRLGKPLTGPSWDHLFGLDDLGRDMLSRVIYGARITLRIGVIIVVIEVTIGVTVGLISGFYGGW